MITSVVGTDPELRKRIEDAYGIINLPASSDAEIQARLQAAMTLAGIKSNPINTNLSFSGSFAPNVQASNAEQKQAEYDAWKKELGISF